MQIRDQVNYAYTLIGLMKKYSDKKGEDIFLMSDFDLLEVNFTNTSVGMISVTSLQEVLRLIHKVRLNIWEDQGKPASYNDMRERLRPNTWFR